MFALLRVIANHLYTKDPNASDPRNTPNYCMKKAGALLARRAYSRGDLQKKLAAFGDDAQVESVLTASGATEPSQ